MSELIKYSKEIFDKAVLDFKPKAIVMMLSGGDDSTTAYHVAKELGIDFDFVIHGNTRTGIEDTTLFARKQAEKFNDNYLEADAGTSYIDYVLRKGFFGKGGKAHGYSYNILKNNHFKSTVSKYLRKRQRNFPILFLNGARRNESERRKKTMISPYHFTEAFRNNIWVNIINEWDKKDCTDYLEGNCIGRNPVSVNLCRSGECMCGTMQSEGDRFEAGYYYPKWKKWLDDLEKVVIDKHGFGWNENKPKETNKIQLDMFQPMCTGCKVNYDNSLDLENIV